MLESLLGLAVVSLLAPVFAEYANIRKTAEKGFSLIGGAGVLYILSRGFSQSSVLSKYAGVASKGAMLFNFIAWIFLLVGAIMAAYKIAIE